MDYLFHIVPAVAVGLQITLKIFIITIILSLPLGILMAIGRISKIAILRKAMYAYIYVMRGTPLMLQILFIYYGLPFITDGLKLPAFPAAIIAFVLNYAAYFAEIFRGGIQSISQGQLRAGLSLGMTYGQTMRYIVLPQAFKRIIPPLGNEFIAMLKDSSLVSVIGFEELTRSGQLVIAETYATMEIWAAVALLYLIMTLSISQLVSFVERRYRLSDER